MKLPRLLCFLMIPVLLLTGCSKLVPDAPESPTVPTSAPTTPSTEPTRDTEPEAESEPVSAVDYAAYESLLSGASLNDEGDYTYCVYDLNEDGIRELIVKIGTCEADFIYHFYSLDENNQLMQLGTFSASHSVLFADEEKPGILHLSALMDYQTITHITVDNGRLVCTIQEEGLAPQGRYYQNSSPLTVCPVTDPSLLAETAQLVQHIDITPEPTQESHAVPYLQIVNRWDQPIYDGPGYMYNYVGIVNIVGTYTIIEESWDADGHLWGKLKSGAGWIDITDANAYTPSPEPFSADFADESFLRTGNYHHCIADTSEYMVQVVIRANRVLTNFRLVGLAFTDGGFEITEEFFFIAELNPDKPLVADVAFPGDLSSYGIIFEDSNGVEQKYIISTSGLDGSIWIGRESFLSD